MLRFKMAAYLHSIMCTENSRSQGSFARDTMCLRMLDLSAWIAAAFLLHTRAHAALTLHSSVKRTPCDVQYVVLRASISSSCIDQCSLLLRSAAAAEPQLDQVSAQGDSGLEVTSASILLLANVVTFQHPPDRHVLEISCQADSDCTASPNSWQVEKKGSGLLLPARSASQYPASVSQATCVQEVNSTVSMAVTGKAADMMRQATDRQVRLNAVFTWSIRAAVLASIVILQLSSR